MAESIILKLALDSNYLDSIPENEEYRKFSDEFYKLCDKLCEGMSEKEKYNTIWNLDMAQSGMEASMSEQYFKAGFKLGLKIAMQSLID